MTPDNTATWTTADELDYLNDIGTHTVLGRSHMSRRELLESYREALKFRPVSERFLNFKRLRQRVEALLADA